MLSRLQEESSTFRRLWAQGNVTLDHARVKRVESPWVGTLRLQAVAMMMQESPRTRLSVHLPADEVKARRLAELTALIESGEVLHGGPALRAVR